MIDLDDLGGWLRKRQEQNRRDREADLPRRLALMTPEAAAHWSRVIERARPFAEAVDPPRPCHYGPWASALSRIQEIDAEWPVLGDYHWHTNPHDKRPMDGLMKFAEMAGCPGWPDDHAHLVEFALLFIEADVMLFRSGYAKRHLLKRLIGADLDEVQIARGRAIVRRAVEQGTGCEEFQQVRRLAARVADEALIAWLEKQAEGVVLTIDDLDTPDYFRLFEVFDEADLSKVVRVSWGWIGTRNWGFSPSEPACLVKRADIAQDNRIRVNAWRILRLIDRVSGAERHTPWV